MDDTQDSLGGAAALLAEDGLVITEVPYLGEFRDRLEYDTVYHEHLCYISVSALMRLFEAVGLSISQRGLTSLARFQHFGADVA